MDAQITQAHTILSSDQLVLRSDDDGIKGDEGPCGGDAPSADAKRTVLTAGSEFEIVWYETVDHPSKYKISFSKDETDTFDVVLMDLENYADDSVKPSDIADADRQDKTGAVNRSDPRKYSYKIKVPNEPCDRCSIQLIQRMFDRDPPSDYFSCADVKIVEAGNEPIPSAPTGLEFNIKK
jgi:predicted carbohydrate-binding protein with CBM5 and CBM33 domain